MLDPASELKRKKKTKSVIFYFKRQEYAEEAYPNKSKATASFSDGHH